MAEKECDFKDIIRKRCVLKRDFLNIIKLCYLPKYFYKKGNSLQRIFKQIKGGQGRDGQLWKLLDDLKRTDIFIEYGSMEYPDSEGIKKIPLYKIDYDKLYQFIKTTDGYTKVLDFQQRESILADLFMD